MSDINETLQKLDSIAADLATQVDRLTGIAESNSPAANVTAAVPAQPVIQSILPANGSAVININPIRTASTYAVGRGTAPDKLVTIGTSDTPTFVDSNIQKGTNYFYSVVAANEKGKSVASKTVEFQHPL